MDQGITMRWQMKLAKPDPKVNETRIKTGFLVFPKSIAGQGRWLELASWKELYINRRGGAHAAPSYCWKPINWVSG